VTKDHGPSVKNDKQYEGLRKKGMSKSRAASIANSPGASSRGGESSGSGNSGSRSSKSSGSGSGGNHAQKVAAGRKGGKKSAASSWSRVPCLRPPEATRMTRGPCVRSGCV
jgi:hypothetical protein